SSGTSTARRRRPRGLLRPVALGASMLAAVSVLAACGGSSSGSSSSKTFVAAVPALPSSLDPSQFSGGTRPYLALMDSMLFNYKSGGCDSPLSGSELVGQLAKSWTASPDGKSYDIVLND